MNIAKYMMENKLLLIFFVILNFLIIKFFNEIKVFHYNIDYPGKKNKIHKIPTSLAGGTIIIINILLFFIFDLINFFNIINVNFYIGCLLIFILGFLDDKHDLSYLTKFIFLISIFTLIFIIDDNFRINNLYFDTFKKEIFVEEYSLLITVFCLLLYANALNMFDGINLQSIIYSATIILYLTIINPNLFLILILIVLFCLFYLNYKNYLFLGNSGSYLLSFIISYFVIANYNFSTIKSCEDILILMLLPGIDMLRLFVERVLNKRNPFKGDNKHIHHLLTNKFGYKKSIILISFFLLANISFLLLNVNKLIIIVFILSVYFLIIFYLKNIKDNPSEETKNY